jgi:hypothetical protein
MASLRQFAQPNEEMPTVVLDTKVGSQGRH